MKRHTKNKDCKHTHTHTHSHTHTLTHTHTCAQTQTHGNTHKEFKHKTNQSIFKKTVLIETLKTTVVKLLVKRKTELR